jgi:hypothetical protein
MLAESNGRARVVRFATFEVDLATREFRKSGVKIASSGESVGDWSLE